MILIHDPHILQLIPWRSDCKLGTCHLSSTKLWLNRFDVDDEDQVEFLVLDKIFSNQGKLIIKFNLNGKIPFISSKTRDTNIFTRSVIDLMIKSRLQSELMKCSSFTGV